MSSKFWYGLSAVFFAMSAWSFVNRPVRPAPPASTVVPLVSNAPLPEPPAATSPPPQIAKPNFAPPESPAPLEARLFGTWVNEDPNTGGTTRFEITPDGGRMSIHAWGRCHPTDCDWKTSYLHTRESDFGVNWNLEGTFSTRYWHIVLINTDRIKLEDESAGLTYFMVNKRPNETTAQTTPQPPARLPVDLDRHCKAHGYTGTTNLDGTGYGWRCVPGEANLSVDQACQEQYGGGFNAALLSDPPGGKNDWYCR